MPTREIWNYHEDGTITKEIIEVEFLTVDVETQIQQKEQQLLSMYEELERLKSLQNS